MPDREKVIKGLEYHLKELRVGKTCFECPYYGDNPCEIQLIANAIALLKEQKALVPGGDSGMCEICSFYERALPVKPHYNARTNWYECGACHYSMTSGMHCKGELIPAYKVGFCAKCGRKQEWG